MPTLLTSKIALEAGKTVVRKAVVTRAYQPFLAAPVVLHSCKPSSNRQHTSANSSATEQQQQAVGQQHQQQQHLQSDRSRCKQKQRRGPLRRLRLFCAGAATALPAAGLKTAVISGVQHLASITSFAGISGAAVVGLTLGLTGKGLRRWHASRRAAKRALVTASMGPAAEVTVLSFNIRGVMDRWPERAPVLRNCLKQADADVVCFQEVLTGEFGQEQLLLGSSYHVHECRAALQHLSSSSMLGAAFSAVVRSLLNVSWARSMLVSLPEGVEKWRERNNLTGGLSRLLRDMTIVPFYGNSIATRLQTVTPDATNGGGSSSKGSLIWPEFFKSSKAATGDLLILGDFRAAQRICLQLQLSQPQSSRRQQQQQHKQRLEAADLPGQQPGSGISSHTDSSSSAAPDGSQQEVVNVWLVNTHLDHAAPENRARQMQAICEWVEPLKLTSGAIVITGDLNAPPDEGLHQVMAQYDFASTHKLAHGSEPAFTWPSGIVAPLMDQGDPHCADYIYAWQAPGCQLQVVTAQLCGDKPAEGDSTLYPSDHIGLKVTLRIVAHSKQQQQP